MKEESSFGEKLMEILNDFSDEHEFNFVHAREEAHKAIIDLVESVIKEVGRCESICHCGEEILTKIKL